ncbi:hypothetical protein ROHU_031189 [Labeo rohita]|uniref:Uncharacterized protein n=1 Tax=Labeo rohita TaxID=84645 RepID=A0A498LN51_LABRO|nr:hypothetical protein ROHU_031189 [Labeo rohita]
MRARGPRGQTWTVVGEQEAPAPRSRPIVGKEEPEAASGTDTLDRTFPFPGALPLSLSGRTGPWHAKSRLLRRQRKPSIDHAVNTAGNHELSAHKLLFR